MTLSGASAGAFAQFADATNIWTGQIGVKADRGGREDVTAYSNVTTFSGSAFTQGPAVANGVGVLETHMDADDISVIPAAAGTDVLGFTFSSANFNGADVLASPSVVFWADDGSGNVGDALFGIRFNGLTLGAGLVQLWSFSSATNLFTLPASGQIWMGVSWDIFADFGGTANATDMANLGQGLFNPPTSGSSEDVFFETDSTGSNFGNAPAGGYYYFGGNPVANMGNEIITASPVPEPASLAVIGLGLVGLAARKRRKA